MRGESEMKMMGWEKKASEQACYVSPPFKDTGDVNGPRGQREGIGGFM